MGINPQGFVNRLASSVIFGGFPQLNVVASFGSLGKQGIRMTLDGEMTTPLPTMVGAAMSPEPYQMATINIMLLKTQPLAINWRIQAEISTLLGNATVRLDSTIMPPYKLTNCAIRSSPSNIEGDGSNPDFPVVVIGFYNINASLFL